MTHYIVTGLGYGDEGKGTVTDWLCKARRPVAVVRHNGGPQAGHNVSDGGVHHTFAQFGSGTLRGIPTFLSRFMMIDPIALGTEAEYLVKAGISNPLSLLTADSRALLVTPYHAIANRARERSRGKDRHGSCGMGIGETKSYAIAYPDDAPVVSDLEDPGALLAKLVLLRQRLQREGMLLAEDVEPWKVAFEFSAVLEEVATAGPDVLAGILDSGPAVFEGAQGVLLDEEFGWQPHTTWSTTTAANAEALLGEAGHQAVKIGVIRCYATRHGPGPFVTEDSSLGLPEPHIEPGEWPGAFRTGHFDAPATRYALDANGEADVIALTHVDTAARTPDLRICENYLIGGSEGVRAQNMAPRSRSFARLVADGLVRPLYGDPVDDWPAAVSKALGIPVGIISAGPRAEDKAVVDMPCLVT